MQDQGESVPSSVRSARVAVASYFAIMGIVCATWVSSIPAVKELLELTDARLGLLLFSGPIGNMVSFLFISTIVTRLGSRRATALGATLYCLATGALGACFVFKAPFPVWCVALGTFGGTGNLLNVAANTQAGIVERLYGRTILNSFHAMWSLCNLAGGLIALLALNLGVAAEYRFAVTVVLSLAVHFLFVRRLIEGDAYSASERGHLHWPDLTLLALCVAAIFIMAMEGAIGEWAGVFFKDSLKAPEGRILWGYCAAMTAMTIGRFVTDGFVNRFGATAILRTYCVLSSLGLGFAISTPYLPLAGLPLHLVAAAGYAVAGFGISGLIPIVYSRAMKTKTMAPGSAVTLVGSMGFFGYFFGPPVIGYVSDHWTLSAALGIFCVLVLSCLFIRVGDR